MTTPCGIFWDIQNIDVPRGSTADAVVDRIRSNIIGKYDLSCKDFYVVGAYNTLTIRNVEQLISKGATFEEAEPGRNVADSMIIRRMERFVFTHGNGSTIILLTGDGGFGNILKMFRENYGIKIYFIRYNNCFSDKLKVLADRVFLLKRDTLDLIYESDSYINRFNDSIETARNIAKIYQTAQTVYSAFRSPSANSNQSSTSTSNASGSTQNCELWFPGIRSKTFVKITCTIPFPPKILSQVQNDLSYYGCSYAIVTNDDVWCLFDDISDARSALSLKGKYEYKCQSFNIDTSIETPPQEVINLIVSAKLSNRKLVRNSSGTLNMSQYKVGDDSSGITETLNNMTEIYNTMQTIYSAFEPSSANSNRSSKSRSNNSGCAQS